MNGASLHPRSTRPLPSIQKDYFQLTTLGASGGPSAGKLTSIGDVAITREREETTPLTPPGETQELDHH